MEANVNERCIGCGLCASVCPQVFSMTSDDLAVAKKGDVPEECEDETREAAANCPVDAIDLS